jgi:hypothetical protein
MKINKTFAISLILLSLLQGCATSSVKISDNLTKTYTPIYLKPQFIDLPERDIITTIEVGDSLISKEKMVVIPYIELNEVIQRKSSNVGIDFTLTALPGRYEAKGNDINGIFYQARVGAILSNNQPIKASCGIYVPYTEHSKTELYCLSATGLPVSYPQENINYTLSSSVVRDEVTFKKELVYTGVSKNVISIVYREFMDNTARPAFTQEITYDLNEGKVVGYKGARFKVIKATNQGLEYVAIEPLK